MRVFLDTNVIVSAFVARGLCADLFRLLLAENDLIVGEVVLAELRDVLRTKLGAPEQVICELESLLREQIVVRRPAEPSALEIADPDDAWVLASAIAGEADVLVTGDQDLLAVASDASIPIWAPRRLWEHLRQLSAADPSHPASGDPDR